MFIEYFAYIRICALALKTYLQTEFTNACRIFCFWWHAVYQASYDLSLFDILKKKTENNKSILSKIGVKD